MGNDPLFRFNAQLNAVHLAFLLDETRNGAAILRDTIEDAIKDSEYDYKQLKAAADQVVAQSDDPRSQFKDMARTGDIFDMADGIDSAGTQPDTQEGQEVTHES